jgi:hypothetical protein
MTDADRIVGEVLKALPVCMKLILTSPEYTEGRTPNEAELQEALEVQ